ncbi:hypothetical protein FHW69_001605 [Luteibacter sp. Sphag1AF]|nr:hypothetical protein [Luteibacter sp. Sphag1AF]
MPNVSDQPPQPMLPPDALGGGNPVAMPLQPQQERVFNIKAKRVKD